MCDEPISAADGVSLQALERAGWSNAELIWEQVQEAAAAALRQGDVGDAAELWAGALELAREQFTAADPRLATSLANCAFGRRAMDDEAAAAALLAEAQAVWARAGHWLEALRPQRRARSSTFHLRLEAKHPGGYVQHSRLRYLELAEQGRTAVHALAAGAPGDPSRFERWQREKPAGFDDGRKLLGAVLLLA